MEEPEIEVVELAELLMLEKECDAEQEAGKTQTCPAATPSRERAGYPSGGVYPSSVVLAIQALLGEHFVFVPGGTFAVYTASAPS